MDTNTLFASGTYNRGKSPFRRIKHEGSVGYKCDGCAFEYAFHLFNQHSIDSVINKHSCFDTKYWVEVIRSSRGNEFPLDQILHSIESLPDDIWSYAKDDYFFDAVPGLTVTLSAGRQASLDHGLTSRNTDQYLKKVRIIFSFHKERNAARVQSVDSKFHDRSEFFGNEEKIAERGDTIEYTGSGSSATVTTSYSVPKSGKIPQHNKHNHLTRSNNKKSRNTGRR